MQIPLAHQSPRLARKIVNMSENSAVFTKTPPSLLPVLEELRRREPIFHTLERGSSRADFENLIPAGYWEVGASGRRYTREFILKELEKKPPVDAASAGWRTYDHAVKQLGSETYLMTYTLRQLDRVTRRATIWQEASDGWRILYHQGTIVSAEADDTYTPTLAQMSAD